MGTFMLLLDHGPARAAGFKFGAWIIGRGGTVPGLARRTGTHLNLKSPGPGVLSKPARGPPAGRLAP